VKQHNLTNLKDIRYIILQMPNNNH